MRDQQGAASRESNRLLAGSVFMSSSIDQSGMVRIEKRTRPLYP